MSNIDYVPTMQPIAGCTNPQALIREFIMGGWYMADIIKYFTLLGYYDEREIETEVKNIRATYPQD